MLAYWNKSSPEHIPRTRLATACSASNIDDLYQTRSTHEQKEQGLHAVGKVATMANKKTLFVTLVDHAERTEAQL